MTDTRAKRQDGIKSVADIQLRCRVVAETGCLIWAGASKGTSARVWVSGHGVMSMTAAITLLATGQRSTPQRSLIPTCGHANCANLAHRVMGTRSDLFSALIPEIDAAHRASIARGRRKTSRFYSPSVAQEIRASREPAQALADRYGMHVTHVYRIRRGQAWRDGVAGSSVWAMAA